MATPDQAEIFFTIDQLRRNVEASGSHFFDAATMRFFRSRVAPGMIGARFFITSEKTSFYDLTRAYRVRFVVKHPERNDFLEVCDLYAPDADQTRDNVPTYPTLGQARTAARQAYRALNPATV